jgi:glutamate/tyrosine decarboxylase-like PLP-dependent enzyme
VAYSSSVPEAFSLPAGWSGRNLTCWRGYRRRHCTRSDPGDIRVTTDHTSLTRAGRAGLALGSRHGGHSLVAMDTHDLLTAAATHAATYLDDVDTRPVAASVDHAQLRERLGGPLPEHPSDAHGVLDELVAAVEPGLVHSAGGRFFGFVVGGALPVSVAADWMTAAWDQNAGIYVLSPAGAVVEEVAGDWARDLLGLPPSVSVGFTTGDTMANLVGLAAARSRVLERAGWDVARQGLFGAPPIEVVVGAQRHVSISVSLRYLGLGSERVHVVPVDTQGRMRADALATVLRELAGRPLIVCAQAGEVNSGAFDPVGEICDIAHAHHAWVHVDGAFGLWAAAAPSLRHLTEGMERADSWATDAHKWLNVPYDSGLAFVADPAAHRAATSLLAADYLVRDEVRRDASDWVPELSRRARGFSMWAALRQLGRAGVAELVERCCGHARRFAEQLGAADRVEILNDVVLNQVLVRFLADDGDHDRHTRDVIARVQADGTCWMGGTSWQGKAAMRISVSNWSTTTEDVDRSVAAVLRAAGR